MNSKAVEFHCDGITLRGKLDLPENMGEKAPLLVLLHGLTGYMEERHITAVAQAALDAEYAVLRVDQYGHGTSDGQFRDHNILIWMLQAMKVIGTVRTWPFVSGIYLSGHSQGGLNTILVGGMMSDCIRALIPLSPAMNIVSGARTGEFLGSSFDKDTLPEELEFKGLKLSADYIRAARMAPVEQATACFQGPVLIVHGTGDEIVPYELAPALQAAYANAELVPIPGDTHCYDSHLELVTEAVRSFLIRIRE